MCIPRQALFPFGLHSIYGVETKWEERKGTTENDLEQHRGEGPQFHWIELGRSGTVDQRPTSVEKLYCPVCSARDGLRSKVIPRDFTELRSCMAWIDRVLKKMANRFQCKSKTSV